MPGGAGVATPPGTALSLSIRTAEAVYTNPHVQVGAEFLGFRIEELIGQGGMGVVYRAYDLRLKRTVALKLVAPELELDDRFRERFAQESELAMSLEHPNVVPIYDSGDADGRLYLAMRLVDGTDLRAVLREESTLAPPRALAICGQVAKALDAAHARGLVHRDVKPSNVLLDESEHVYLADFGLTRRLEEQGAHLREGRSLGTPAYLAPEQIGGAPVDGRADVYSLGCVLYECLTGETPFPRVSRLAVAWAHLEEEAPRASQRNRDLPEALDAVIARALAKDPDERFRTGAALVGAAERALGLGRPRASRVRNGVIAVAISTILAAAAVALAVAVRPSREAPTLFGRPNSLVRIDPVTDEITAVIDVGVRPTAVAVGGRGVWVYNDVEESVTEIDAATNAVRRTVPLSTADPGSGALTGPVLAADAEGGWAIGVDRRERGVLTRIPVRGRKREYELGLTPRAVAAGYGAVWVVGGEARRNEVLRIDPTTGRVLARALFPATARIDGIVIGWGAVFVSDSSRAILYRLDRRTGRRRGQVDLGARGQRPFVDFGGILMAVSDGGGTTRVVDAVTMEVRASLACCPPEWGQTIRWHGTDWTYDWPTASVLKWRSSSNAKSIQVAESAPKGGGPCLTAIAAGADGVWVTAASSLTWYCRP